MVKLKGSASNAAIGLTDQVTTTKSGTKTGLDVNNIASLVPEAYDFISLSYTGNDLTGVVYKQGGSSGTTVATLTLAYTSNILDTVART